MIDRGGLFAALRTRMLANRPLGSQAAFKTRTGLADWISNGTYLVDSCTKQAITLHANPADFATASLAEIENLLNHALEHVQELACKYADKRRRSDAWATVTAYYLGFFSAAVLLHLVGEPIVFLTREHLQVVRNLAGLGLGPSQGTFQFRVGASVSLIYSEITLQPTQKIHEATWKRAISLIDNLRGDASIVLQAGEADFYDSLCTRAFYSPGIGFDWPSSVRNQANYRPGFAYRLFDVEFSVNKFLDGWREGNLDELYSMFRGIYLRCTADRSNFASQAEMMVGVAVTFYILVRELYKDLVSRSFADRRWEVQRKAFKTHIPFPPPEFETLRV